MVVVFIKIDDFGSHILEIISELENKLNVKFHLFEKVLLVETGNVEQVLSILTNSEIVVKILKQNERNESIERDVNIINKKTGEKLVYARSNIIPSNLPQEIVSRIRRKDVGIGSIITTSELETFRKILRIGYSLKTKSVSRTYQIIYKGKVGFEIKEVFFNLRQRSINLSEK